IPDGPDTPTIFPSDSYYHPGANLSLTCHSASNPPAQYSWLINGKPQPSTQELFIPNITVNHSGSYTCLVYNPGTHLNKTTVKTITVSEPVSQPSVHVSRETVIEYVGSVVLTCSTNDKGVSMWWFFNGQSLHLMERMKLSQDNSTLTIDPVRREDAGTYQCEVSNPVSSSKSDPIRLTVSYEESTTGLTVGTSVGIAIGVLVAVALLAVLVALVVILLRARIGRTGCLRNQREIGNPASTPGEYPFSPGSPWSP
ncbi:cell adhesion molecule CEACAM1-like, partial [Crocuta crocuta]